MSIRKKAHPRPTPESARHSDEDVRHTRERAAASSNTTQSKTDEPHLSGKPGHHTHGHRPGRAPHSEKAAFDTSPARDDFDVGAAYRSDRSAFLRDPQQGPAHSADDIAEELAEQFLNSATSDEDRDDVSRQEPSIEEEGGPFVPSSAAEELASEPDASNPRGAEPAPFPTTQSEG